LEVYTVVVLALPIVLGLAKIMVGSSRGKPGGNLEFLVLLTAAFGFFCLIRQPTRTRRGREALERASDEGSRAFRAPQASELALSFAVSGAAVLTGTQFEAFGNMVRPRIEGGGCGSVGDGGGDGGCGGGGC
jgi:uncharacterized protein (TIGR04222 family)